MSRVQAWRAHRTRDVDQAGVVLVLSLLLMLIMTLMAVTGLTAAALELRMAGNHQQQQNAFQAAEFALEQAYRSTTLSLTDTLASPSIVPASGGDLPVPGVPEARYRYRLYFDTSAGAMPAPGAPPGVEAYHFIVEATGSAGRGASVALGMGFHVLGPAGCDAPGAICDFDSVPRHRDYWLQQGVE